MCTALSTKFWSMWYLKLRLKRWEELSDSSTKEEVFQAEGGKVFGTLKIKNLKEDQGGWSSGEERKIVKKDHGSSRKSPKWLQQGLKTSKNWQALE